MILTRHLNESGINSNHSVYFLYCSFVQGRKAGASKFDSVIRGQHVYKSAWTSFTDKMSKCTLWEENEHNKYVVNDWPWQHLNGECTHQERHWEYAKFFLMYGIILTFIKFNNFGTRCSDGPGCSFHLFYCTIRCIFEPLCVYEPGFNTDKYSMMYNDKWCVYVYAYIMCCV